MINKKKIIIDFIDYYKHQKKLIEILNGIRDFLSSTKKNYDIEIISFCPDLTKNKDYLSKIIQKSSFKKQKIKIITEFENTKDFLETISKANITINMRYHGSLVSMIYGIPSVNIIYDIHAHYPNKMQFLSKLFKMEKFFINFSETNRENIKKMLIELTSQKNMKKELKIKANKIKIQTKKEYLKLF